MRILIVEDDKRISKFLKVGLESECFAVDSADDGERGIYLALTNDYDVVLLDRILPKKDGAAACVEIKRGKPGTKIIIVSAIGDAKEKAEFLDIGADDYVSKPFSFTELVARIRAVMRRGVEGGNKALIFGDLEIDVKGHRVTNSGREISLTKKEFMLLELLAVRAGSIVSRADIIEHVWDAEGDPFSNSIETHISNIRRKVEPCRNIIKTVSGIGYRFDPDCRIS